MRADAETHSQTSDRAHGTPQKRGRKDCSSQRSQWHQENVVYSIDYLGLIEAHRDWSDSQGSCTIWARSSAYMLWLCSLVFLWDSGNEGCLWAFGTLSLLLIFSVLSCIGSVCLRHSSIVTQGLVMGTQSEIHIILWICYWRDIIVWIYKQSCL